VHFVGHSAGAQVVRVLHQMLADKVHKQEIFRFYSTSDSCLLLLVELVMPIMCFQRDGSCELEYMIRAPKLG
jgi:hypothetical protein